MSGIAKGIPGYSRVGIYWRQESLGKKLATLCTATPSAYLVKTPENFGVFLCLLVAEGDGDVPHF